MSELESNSREGREKTGALLTAPAIGSHHSPLVPVTSVEDLRAQFIHALQEQEFNYLLNMHQIEEELLKVRALMVQLGVTPSTDYPRENVETRFRNSMEAAVHQVVTASGEAGHQPSAPSSFSAATPVARVEAGAENHVDIMVTTGGDSAATEPASVAIIETKTTSVKTPARDRDRDEYVDEETDEERIANQNKAVALMTTQAVKGKRRFARGVDGVGTTVITNYNGDDRVTTELMIGYKWWVVGKGLSVNPMPMELRSSQITLAANARSGPRALRVYVATGTGRECCVCHHIIQDRDYYVKTWPLAAYEKDNGSGGGHRPSKRLFYCFSNHLPLENFMPGKEAFIRIETPQGETVDSRTYVPKGKVQGSNSTVPSANAGAGAGR